MEMHKATLKKESGSRQQGDATGGLGENPGAEHADVLQWTTKERKQSQRLEKKREGKYGEDYEAVEPDPSSNETLMQHYKFLLQSPDFWNLARIINSEKKIILTDVSDAPDLYEYYDDETHKIHVTLHHQDGTAKSAEELRDVIAWEVRNGTMRGQFKRIEKNFSEEDIKADPFKRAAQALASEWLEWINIMEHAWFCRVMNNDPHMGAEGPHIKEIYRSQTKPGHEWYDFRNYLKTQIQTGHTLTAFDRDAANASWIGNDMLSIIEKRYPASLIMTEKQVSDWRITKATRKIKSPSNNPFNSLTLVEQARQRAAKQTSDSG